MKKLLSLIVLALVLTTNVTFANSVSYTKSGLIVESKSQVSQPATRYVSFDTSDLIELPFEYSAKIQIVSGENQKNIAHNKQQNNAERIVLLR